MRLIHLEILLQRPYFKYFFKISTKFKSGLWLRFVCLPYFNSRNYIRIVMYLIYVSEIHRGMFLMEMEYAAFNTGAFKRILLHGLWGETVYGVFELCTYFNYKTFHIKF